MDLRTRLIAPLFQSLDGEVKVFDLDAFVKRTLLFETYIIHSHNLEEIPHLVNVFGFDGLLMLLETGEIKLDCTVNTTGSLGPSMFINEPVSNKIRPPYHYAFVEVATGDFHKNINLSLKDIESKIDLPKRQTIRLRKAIYIALERPPKDAENYSLRNTKEELESSRNLVVRALQMALKKKLGIEVDQSDIEIEIQYSEQNNFKAVSNISKKFSLDDLTSHKIIETACLAIAKRNDWINRMRVFSALASFSEIDLPVFGDKLAFLATALAPKSDEDRFQRIIELTGLPQLDNSRTNKLDAKKLLALRGSKEIVEFRQWLKTTDGLSETEILHQIRSLSKSIANVVHSQSGKSIRFLITNGIGLIPGIGQMTSLTLSILDQFLVDKFLPHSGVAAFVDDLYPSLFDYKD